jgi:hypothetical protein
MKGAEQRVELLAGEAEVLGKKMFQCHVVYHKLHMT